MGKIILVAAIALLYSSPSWTADEGRISEGLQYTQYTYHDDGFDVAKPIVWAGNYAQITKANVTTEESSVNASSDRRSSDAGTSVGLGVAPYFGTYGVFRTSSSLGNSTYLALGFTLDELTMDEADTSYSKETKGLSYGFGISNSSFNIEYMMSVDEENYEVSAVSLGFVSEF